VQCHTDRLQDRQRFGGPPVGWQVGLTGQICHRAPQGSGEVIEQPSALEAALPGFQSRQMSGRDPSQTSRNVEAQPSAAPDGPCPLADIDRVGCHHPRVRPVPAAASRCTRPLTWDRVLGPVPDEGRDRSATGPAVSVSERTHGVNLAPVLAGDGAQPLGEHCQRVHVACIQGCSPTRCCA
jgi:hypothetical protein